MASTTCTVSSATSMSTTSTVEQLTQENLELQEENAELKKTNATLRQENLKLQEEVSNLKKRKATLAPIFTGGAAAAPSSSNNHKKAKTPAQPRKLFEKWAEALKRESAKLKIINACGAEVFIVTVKASTPWTPEQFHSLFRNKGGKTIQPTPDNKPTSQITVLQFTVEQAQQLFGSAGADDDVLPRNGYSVQLWRRRNFSQSYNQGNGPAEMSGLHVHYNKSKQTLQLKFTMTFSPGDDW